MKIMKTNCLNCKNENPKIGMKTCSRKCADEIKKINSRENRTCLFCKEEFSVRKKDKKKLCNEECRKNWASLPENIAIRIDASKKYLMDNFGVENIFQLENIKQKSKQTKLERYGDENYNNSEKQITTVKNKYGDDYYVKMAKKRKDITFKKHGVEHHLQLKECKDKQKNTVLKKYGVENVSQLKEFKQKRTDTMIERFGFENASQNEEIKQKKKQTSIKNFGVEHHLKDGKMFQKHMKAQFKMLNYKDTDLSYQGTYEKFFLDLMDKENLLDHVSNGDTFEYEYDNKKHAYHVDFKFKDKLIEIKSGWTYNKNGKDLELQKINEAKWKSVRDSGEILIVLIDKSEIKGFIKGLL